MRQQQAVMRRLFIVTALAVAAGIGLLSSRSVMSALLTPFESDTSQRELLIAAGAGKVSEVRTLLAQGIRPEPETVAAAVVGVFEPIYSWSGCDRHADVTRMLLAASPKLRLGAQWRADLVRKAARLRRCGEVHRLLEQTGI